MKRFEQYLYYDDIEPGDEFISPSRTISESDIFQFAGLTGDFNELHTSETYAEASPYKTRIVHGMLTLAIANGLYVRIGAFKSSVFLGIDSWKFTKPVHIGDTIKLKMSIADKRLTRDEKRGIVGMRYEVIDQKDETVSEGVLRRMIDRRAKDE